MQRMSAKIYNKICKNMQKSIFSMFLIYMHSPLCRLGCESRAESLAATWSQLACLMVNLWTKDFRHLAGGWVRVLKLL